MSGGKHAGTSNHDLDGRSQVVRFTITAFVDTDPDAHDDPEWVCRCRLYGIECVYGYIAKLSANQ